MKTTVKLLSIMLIGVSIFTIFSYLKETNNSKQLVEDYKNIYIQEEIIEESIEEEKNNFPIEEEETFESITYDIEENLSKTLIDEITNYVGWITIDNTRIDYPVVKTNDNEFYLDHGYDLKENIAGTIFMDRRNVGNEFDKHTIIYGHHMKNGSMFTDLNLYLDESFYKENKFIYFEDLYQTYTYEIISAYYISANDYELTYDISETLIEDFMNRSLFESKYSYNDDDRFITLSTCNYILDNGRMMIHGVLSKKN